MRIAWLVALSALVTPAAANACTFAEVGVFELAERADIVATGRWTGSHIEVTRTLFGRRRARLARQHPHARCRIETPPGRRVVVLADASGQPLSLLDGVVDLHEHPGLVAVLERWRDADDAGRHALLVELATGSEPWLARAASRLLVQMPWIDRLTAADVDRLAAALALGDARTAPLALVLARTHSRSALAPLIACTRDQRHWLECSGALRILSFREGPGALTLADELVPGTSEDRVAHAWERWVAELPPGADPIAIGWSERGLADPGGEPAALAERIRVGPDRLARIVALDRCERVLGRSLTDFNRVQMASDAALASLAALCTR